VSELPVAIVTPSYNTGRYVGATVRSVLEQGYAPLDYLVMDGGSTDETVEVLKSFGARVRWVSERDKGQSDAINRGFGQTRGEVLGWLNSDDTYAPGALRAAAEFLAAHPDVAMVYGDADFIDASGQRIGRCQHVEPVFNPHRLLHYSDFIVQPAAFFRRSAFEAVGGLDPSLNWAMDYDLWLKFAAAGFKVAYLPRALANYRWLLTREPFLTWMFNSLFLASTHTVLVVTLSSLGGFALAKYKFPGRRVLMVIMLATMMLPAQVLLPSSYELMFRIGWIDSYAAIVVPSAVSVFGMFLFMQAMRGVPDELLQAGRVDGCSELRLWWEIALPVIRPMIGAYTLLSFMGSWNSFVWPQIVLQNQDHFTLPIAMTNMIGLPEYEAPLGGIMAGTLLSILPIAILFFILQKDFIAGLTSGAVKG